jgi:spermidine/putrescine transport system substrate-binding protein
MLQSLSRWALSGGFVFSLLIAGASSCTKKSVGPNGDPSAATSAGSGVVNLAIWSNYVSPELLKKFTDQTGIRVQISNYSSNEELLAKLQAGATGFDVAVPSDYMVSVMVHTGLLNELDPAKIPNLKALDAKYLKRGFDPQNKFSVPYDWGTTGIAINRTIFKGKISGWKDLFTNPELKGKFTLLDDVRETLGAALKSEGFSLNSKDPAQLEKAKKVLMGVRSRVKGFTSEPMMPLVNGETAVAHVYMSDALQAARETGGKIEYIVPVEGATLWIDNLVIPKGAPNVPGAHQLINFLLEASSVVETVKSVMVSPTNPQARSMLPEELKKHPALFPSDAVLQKCEMLEDLGEALASWDRIWTEVKAASE